MAIENEPMSETHVEEGAHNRAATISPPAQETEDSAGITEETAPLQQRGQLELSLDVPPRNLEDSYEDSVRINMPQTPSPTSNSKVNLPPTPTQTTTRTDGSSCSSSSRSKSSIKSRIPRIPFKHQTNSTLEIEKAATATAALGASSAGTPREKTSVSRASSLTKLFTTTIIRTSSLPITTMQHSKQESVQGGSMLDPMISIEKGSGKHIPRSLSVPTNDKAGGSIKRMDSLGGVFRVIPSTPKATLHRSSTSNTTTSTVDAENNDMDGEDIPAEVAVCRICFVELGEGSDTFKLECSCKGELALAHQGCAVKWFSMKGNKNCDVCKQEVQNLPVILLLVQNAQTTNILGNRLHQTTVQQHRVWQDVPVLVIVSMLAYFCFLEQLLVSKMGTGAIALALPFSCILGLLASMTSSTMVIRRFVWVYASIEFALVVLFAHLFYSLLHVQAVLSILLSTFAGFGIAMSGNSILLEFLRWHSERRRRNSRETSHQSGRNTLQNEPPDNNNNNHEAETANPQARQG